VKLPASCFTEQTSGEPREILDVVRRGSIVASDETISCDAMAGGADVDTTSAIARLRASGARVSFKSTDGELRA
jgi:hypothetical protein